MFERFFCFSNDFLSFTKGIITGVITFYTSYFIPIHDFFKVIMMLATINIVFGWVSDTKQWSFRKAFYAFRYLIGYMGLLALSLIVGKLMHINLDEIINFTSWVTWVMIYFYTTNILRNWSVMQPDNKVIGFLYWVVTFKMLEKIKFLKEYNEHQKTKKNNDDTK